MKAPNRNHLAIVEGSFQRRGLLLDKDLYLASLIIYLFIINIMSMGGVVYMYSSHSCK